MKRLALVLTASLLGTGCIIHDDQPDEGSVNIYWSFVRTAPAQSSGFIVYDASDEGRPNGPCDESGVEIVTIDSPVGQTRSDCVLSNGVEGVGIDFLPEGTRSFRVRGWRGDLAVYDETFSLLVRGNETTNHFVDVRAVSAPIDVFADLALAPGTLPGDFYVTCGEATPAGSTAPPNIEIQIRDVVTGALVVEDLVGCGLPSDPLPAPAFVGDLDLDNYTVRMRGLQVGGASNGALVFDSCRVPLDHFAAQTGVNGFAATLLTRPVPTCP